MFKGNFSNLLMLDEVPCNFHPRCCHTAVHSAGVTLEISPRPVFLKRVRETNRDMTGGAIFKNNFAWINFAAGETRRETLIDLSIQYAN
jgi:hypothetical protein